MRRSIAYTLTAISAATIGLISLTATAAPPAPTTSSTTTTTTVAPVVLHGRIDDRITAPAAAKCGQWWALARVAGWSEELLPKIDRLIWREARCDALALNSADPLHGSIGLLQVNTFWCLPTTAYPAGYLQTVGVLDDCDDLYSPAVNLRAGLALAEYSLARGQCVFQQWSRRLDCDVP